MNRSELEKRIKARYPASIYVSIYVTKNLNRNDNANSDFFGLLADLSNTGFKLITESEVTDGEHYDLAIRNPFAGRAGELNFFSVDAVWSRKNDDGLYDSGFHFTDYSGESKGLFKRLEDDFGATAEAINKLEKHRDLE